MTNLAKKAWALQCIRGNVLNDIKKGKGAFYLNNGGAGAALGIISYRRDNVNGHTTFTFLDGSELVELDKRSVMN